ncbi:Uncharacterised protein [Mycobacterium tuberculosis]|nr:Uncharacterised protein [Mycobacterium tuberculosis]
MPQLLAGITLANPLRESGHTYPGDPIGATGKGIAPTLLTDTPDLWWDITNEYDLLANVPSDFASALSSAWTTLTGLHPVSVPQIAKAFLASIKSDTDTIGDLLHIASDDDLLKWLTKTVELLTISGPASFLNTAGTTLLTFTTLATNYLDSFVL